MVYRLLLLLLLIPLLLPTTTYYYLLLLLAQVYIDVLMLIHGRWYMARRRVEEYSRPTAIVEQGSSQGLAQ